MRKLPFLLALLLMSLLLLGASASAHAVALPAPAQVPPFAPPGDDEEEADDESEADEGDEEEADEVDLCESEDEEDEERCEEELAETEEDEECVLEDASASFTAAPGAGEVRLRVHYRAFEPTEVAIDASLRGSKGNLHLGGDRARFHRAGVYRFSFELGTKQLAKAVAAKEFEVDLHAVGTPDDCTLSLATRAHHRAK
ncbi:MAG TPA: hypothetical protein VNN15_00335 [Solirubrobacterales bacterium]|nr:hypothetical protein [Solirubrobacterales bacterium]